MRRYTRRSLPNKHGTQRRNIEREMRLAIRQPITNEKQITTAKMNTSEEKNKKSTNQS